MFPPETRQTRPLIVHLHGSGQHSELAVNERLPAAEGAAGPEPIIVYPQSPGGWRGPAVGELIDTLAKQYSIDATRVYLLGSVWAAWLVGSGARSAEAFCGCGADWWAHGQPG
jgi:poly(3-hydroxybutyrate) depolymerase